MSRLSPPAPEQRNPFSARRNETPAVAIALVVAGLALAIVASGVLVAGPLALALRVVAP